MANITDWYGENDINWGKSYSESWWGSVNEANSWGIIYPASAEGSLITSDSTLFTADMTGYTADNGNGSVVVGSNETPGTLISTVHLIVKTINGTSISARGYADNLTDITNFEGTAISTAESGFIQYDTSTPDVGTFIGDGYGGLITSANTHPSAVVLPWSFFSTPKYIHDVGVGLSGTFDPYPVYKLEQSNGYLKITEKIES